MEKGIKNTLLILFSLLCLTSCSDIKTSSSERKRPTSSSENISFSSDNYINSSIVSIESSFPGENSHLGLSNQPIYSELESSEYSSSVLVSNESSSEIIGTCDITFMQDSSIIYRVFTVEYDSYLSELIPEPEKDKYIFTGWYADELCTIYVDVSAEPVTSDITYYAGWVLSDINDSEIPSSSEETNSELSSDETNNLIRIYFDITWDGIDEAWCNDTQMIKGKYEYGKFYVEFELEEITSLRLDFSQTEFGYTAWWHIDEDNDPNTKSWITDSRRHVSFVSGKTYVVHTINWAYEWDTKEVKWYTCYITEI